MIESNNSVVNKPNDQQFYCAETGDCATHGKKGESINLENNSAISIEVKRKFSSSEQTMKTCMDCGVLTIGAQLQFDVTAPMSMDFFRHSFEEIEARCETLQVNSIYNGKKKKHYWAKMPSCFVRSMHDIGSLNSEDVQPMFNELVARGIGQNETIWRVYFMQISGSQSNCDSFGSQSESRTYRYGFFFIASHALVDGIGLSWVLNYAATSLCKRIRDSNLPNSNTQSEIKPSSSGCTKFITFCPPYEELVPNMAMYKLLTFPLCLSSLLAVKFSTKIRQIPWSGHDLFQSPNLRPLMKDCSNLSSSPGMHMMKFPANEWQKFQEFRKQKGLTVTGLALAMFGVALLKYAYKSSNWPRITLGAHILRDPRRYFKDDQLDPRALIGNYISAGLVVLLPIFRAGNKSIDKVVIEVAKLITQQIRHNVRNFQTFFNGEVLAYIAKRPNLARKLRNIGTRDRRTCGRFFMIQFSNVGPVECAERSAVGDFDVLDVKKFVALADQSICGDCFCNVLLTIQGQLFWTISFPKQLYSDETVSGIAAEVQTIWNCVIKPEQSSTIF